MGWIVKTCGVVRMLRKLRVLGVLEMLTIGSFNLTKESMGQPSSQIEQKDVVLEMLDVHRPVSDELPVSDEQPVSDGHPVIKDILYYSRPYLCLSEGCGRTFKREDHLIVHKRSHSGYKPLAMAVSRSLLVLVCHKYFPESALVGVVEGLRGMHLVGVHCYLA